MKPDESELNLSLLRAAKNGDCAEIRRLIIEGADLNTCDEQSRNVLSVAVANNQHQAIRTLESALEVQKLVRSGVDPRDTMDYAGIIARKNYQRRSSGS